jgi:hypothetical protein
MLEEAQIDELTYEPVPEPAFDGAMAVVLEQMRHYPTMTIR